jgi:hypothetical protein
VHRGTWAQRYWSSPGCLFHHAYPVGYRATKVQFGRTYEMAIEEGAAGPLFKVGRLSLSSCKAAARQLSDKVGCKSPAGAERHCWMCLHAPCCTFQTPTLPGNCLAVHPLACIAGDRPAKRRGVHRQLTHQAVDRDLYCSPYRPTHLWAAILWILRPADPASHCCQPVQQRGAACSPAGKRGWRHRFTRQRDQCQRRLARWTARGVSPDGQEDAGNCSLGCGSGGAQLRWLLASLQSVTAPFPPTR